MTQSVTILGLALSLFGAISGIQFVWEYYNRRTFKHAFFMLFPLKLNERLSIICPKQPDREGYHHPEIHDDLIAATMVASALQKNGLAFDILLSSQVSLSKRQDHLFLLCGPEGNQITGELLKAVTLPFRFHKGEDGRYCICDLQGQIVHGPQGPSHDFALIAKVRNPWANSGDVYIYVAAGIGRLGTQGAALLLCEQTKTINRRLRERSRTAVCFAAVVDCRGDYRGLATSSAILDIRPI